MVGGPVPITLTSVGNQRRNQTPRNRHWCRAMAPVRRPPGGYSARPPDRPWAARSSASRRPASDLLHRWGRALRAALHFDDRLTVLVRFLPLDPVHEVAGSIRPAG